MKERIQGALWGLLVGDALGVPYKFQQAAEIPFADEIELTPPACWARKILHDDPSPWAAALASLRGMMVPGSPEEAELEFQIRPDADAKPEGSGYVVDSLRSAKWALSLGSYPAVVRGAIRLGNDTDTTAAIAGGLAGLRDGIAAIPEYWRSNLRQSQIFAPLLAKLVDRALG